MAAQPESVDTVIDAGWVIPVAPHKETVLQSTSVIIHQGKIHDILPTTSANAKYKATSTHLDRTCSILLPGLINAHTHAGMTMMRGKADDMALMPWLSEAIWPMEAEFTSDPDFCCDGTLLACAEMIRGGVTTFADMYFYPEATAPVIVETGMRAVLGLISMKFPTAYAADFDGYFERGQRVFKSFKHHWPQLSFAYAPHAPYTIDSEDWIQLRDASKVHGIPIHTHLHETEEECTASLILDRTNPACHLSRSKCHPLQDLDNNGLLNDKFIAAHMVHLTDEEIIKCSQRGVHVVHCPTSNSKLASGFCPIHKLLKENINVALGTDSACSNNSLDLRAEMKLAALNAKNLARDASVVPACEAIKMATINGAKAFGLDKVTGSLEIGKRADVIAIEVESHPGNFPVYNAHSTVVYASERADVRDVLVDGKFLMKDWEHCTIDMEGLFKRVKEWKQLILDKFPISNVTDSNEKIIE